MNCSIKPPGGKSGRDGEASTFLAEGALDFNVLSFWQWSTSDPGPGELYAAGQLAEYLVAQPLGVANDGIREEWAPYDLRSPEGITVEVKSAAYIQSWHQERLSPIVFSCPKTRA